MSLEVLKGTLVKLLGNLEMCVYSLFYHFGRGVQKRIKC